MISRNLRKAFFIRAFALYLRGVNESADPDYSYTQPPAPTHTHHDYEPIICFRLCGLIFLKCRWWPTETKINLNEKQIVYNRNKVMKF
jgi:hypothetical protein